MRAGNLRTRVYLEAPLNTTNAVGEPVVEWELVREVWAARRGLGGSEVFAGEQHTAVVRTEWEFRYRQPFDPRWRIREKHNNQVHEIEGPPQDPDGRRRTLMVTTSTAQPQPTTEWVP